MEKFKAADEKNNNFLERNAAVARSVGRTVCAELGTERGEDVLTPNTLIAHLPLPRARSDLEDRLREVCYKAAQALPKFYGEIFGPGKMNACTDERSNEASDRSFERRNAGGQRG